MVLMANCFRWVKTRNQPKRDIRLVIVGLDDAGKSTTIASLEGEPPDGITPTIGFCNATLTFSKWNVTLYDLGGGTNVRSVWEKYYAEIYGIIFAVDSSNKDRLEESRDVLSKIFLDPKLKGKPALIFANKQDVTGAANENEIIDELELKSLSELYSFQFQVFPCSAIKGYGKHIDPNIKKGINWLLDAINEDYSTIHEKVEKESAIQKEKEALERKERLERIRKLREEREKAAKEAGIEESEEESDDDVVTGANPFRKIDDQIVVTEKREKKEKAKMKMIKEHQERKEQENEANSDMENAIDKQTSKKKGKKKKKVLISDSMESEDESNNMRRPKVTLEEPTPRRSDESSRAYISPVPKRKRKKKRSPSNRDSRENENSSKYENMNGHSNKNNRNNPTINGSSTVIYVSSAENLKETIRNHTNEEDVSKPFNDWNSRKRELPNLQEKLRNQNLSDEDSDENDDDIFRKASSKSINDSRIDLFRAKSSSDNMRRSDVNLRDAHSLIDTGYVNDKKSKKKKKKKKKNQTLPSFSGRSKEDPSDEIDGVFSTSGGHLSKLQPIKLKGRLPDLNSEYANMPAWARAKPNSEDHDVMT